MNSFGYVRIENEKSALTAAGRENSVYLAGGTNLLDLMKLRVQQPALLVDVTGLPLDQITVRPDGKIQVGALVKNSTLAHHPEIQKRFPVLSEALLSGASPQLRNMASVGGNLLQRTRCVYFNDVTFPCNKRKPGSGCPAIEGYHRNLAVLGTSESCIATNPSDMNVALAAIDPVIHVRDSVKEDALPYSSFHLLPGQTPHIETTLKPGQLITGIELPALAYGSRSHYLKVRDRSSYEFALASAAVMLDLSGGPGGKIRDARIALGGVGTRPWRSPEAEKVLIGATANDETFRRAAEAALKDARPGRQNSFKVDLARRTLVRALAETLEIQT